MSSMSIAHYFPFRRVKISGQFFERVKTVVRIFVDPDKRFTPICHICGSSVKRIHSYTRRPIRDLNLSSTKVFLHCRYRKVSCPNCQHIAVECLGFFLPGKRVTIRLARYIHELCKLLPVKQVAEHLDLDWKTVKEIDKSFLEVEYGRTDYSKLRILAVDEIAVKKGHKYMTVVLDYETGRVVWMEEGRDADTLKAFFKGMTKEQIQSVEAVAMDMWNPYIKAVRDCAPHIKIVFDLFHVVSGFNKVIDKVRNDEYKKAREEDKRVYKGTKYLLLKRREKLKLRERKRLRELVALNEEIFYVLILKDKLKELWKYKSRVWAEKAIGDWCRLARCLDHKEVHKFAKRLEQYEYGILNHCDYPIHTSCLEGVNNKIKVIKRMAYGFHDERYFALKVIQAFDPENAN